MDLTLPVLALYTIYSPSLCNEIEDYKMWEVQRTHRRRIEWLNLLVPSVGSGTYLESFENP